MLYSSSDGGAKAADADYCSDFECVVISFILDVRFVDVPAGATQEEGHTGFSTFLSRCLP